jgi:hypothetical protein
MRLSSIQKTGKEDIIRSPEHIWEYVDLKEVSREKMDWFQLAQDKF